MEIYRKRRALHWVLKIANRKENLAFFRDLLGMRVLRHEEFEKGCEATCNGPYDGLWSKTMIGYGPEDSHFVLELTYNYGIGFYKYTEDFRGMTINSKKAVAKVKHSDMKFQVKEGPGNVSQVLIHSPDGYPFYLNDVDVAAGMDPVQKVAIASENLPRSIAYWNGVLGLMIYEQGSLNTVLGYGLGQAKLELIGIGRPIDHGTAQGRIAFGAPADQLPEIQSQIQKANLKILTPLITLSTPGKADVQVVILADPDGYEICFVGDEGFRELSKVDPNSDQLINDAMKNDRSEEWFRDGKPSAS